jgi:hypothetical protein
MEVCEGGRGAAFSGSTGYSVSSECQKLFKSYSLALIRIKSDSSSFSPVVGSVPFS